jgi:hypothetical protein
MSRLKQRMNSFINAELNYNRKKGAPKKEFILCFSLDMMF